MKRASLPLLFGSSFLLLLAACADQAVVAAPPPSSSTPLAVDLGNASRVPRIAALAGEGEGYGTVQPASADHASMAGMNNGTGKPVPQTPKSAIDHGAMDHASMAGMRQSDAGVPTSGAPQVAAGVIQGAGIINAVDPSGHKISLSHNAIPAIGWPAMTMEFAVAPVVDLQSIKPGAHVNFILERSNDGMYVIHSITPAVGGH